MAFTILANSTPADCNEVNDDFYHVRQGSLLPLANVNLQSSNASADLGSVAAEWDNVYCTTLNVTTDNTLWHAISESIIASTTSLEITGLNGDIEKEYKILFTINCSGSIAALQYIYVYFNNDSTAANYYYQFHPQNADTVPYYSSTAIYNTITMAEMMISNATNSSGINYLIGSVNLTARTGYDKIAIIDYMGFKEPSGPSSNYWASIGDVYHKNTTTLTSIKFTFPTICTGSIYLMRRGYV